MKKNLPRASRKSSPRGVGQMNSGRESLASSDSRSRRRYRQDQNSFQGSVISSRDTRGMNTRSTKWTGLSANFSTKGLVVDLASHGILTDNDACLWVLGELFQIGSKKGDLPIAIPDTILYEDGAPKTWMRFDKELGKMAYKTVDPQDSRALLDAVLCMNSRFKKCLVWYASGACEELVVTRLFEVFSSIEWQAQIVCVQGYNEPILDQNDGASVDNGSDDGSGEKEKEHEEDKEMNTTKRELVKVDYPQYTTFQDEPEQKELIKPVIDELLLWMNKFASTKVATMSLIIEIEDPNLNGPKVAKPKPLIYWLRFVERVTFDQINDLNPVSPNSPLGSVGGDGNGLSATSVTNENMDKTHKEKENPLDLDFNSYYNDYCSTHRQVFDVVIVGDCFGTEQEAEVIDDLCHDSAKDGLRIIYVSLIKLQGNPRVAATPPSNVLLSNWLHQLFGKLNIGTRTSKPLILGGVGVGANVILHLAAYRKIENVQCILSINGFAHVDRTLTRKVKVLAQRLSRPRAAVLNSMRNGFLDLRSSLRLIKVPMIVVQSTENETVLPLHVEAIVGARGAPQTICSSVTDCLRYQGRVKSHVVWLKASHNVVTERMDYMKTLMVQLNSALKTVNRIAGKKAKGKREAPGNKLGEDGEETRIENSEKLSAEEGGKTKSSSSSSSSSSDHSEESNNQIPIRATSPQKSPTSASSMSSMKLKGSPSGAKAKDRHLMLQPIESEEEMKAKREEIKRQEKERLIKLEQERLAQEKKQRRLDFLKYKPTESEERSAMMDEDTFSKEMRRCFLKEKEWAEQQLVVKERMDELREAREREKKRADQITHAELERKRRLEYEESKIQFDMKDEALEEMLNSTHDILGSSVSGASKIRLDFLKIAQRQATSIERSKQILEAIKDAQASRDEDMKRLAEFDRAVAMLKSVAHLKNPAQASRKRQNKAEQAAKELIEVDAARAEKSKVIDATCVKLKELNNQIAKINSSIQSDSVIIGKKVEDMESMVQKLESVLKSLDVERNNLRKERGFALVRQNDVANLHDSVKKRLEVVEKEVIRCKNIHTKFCDSSIWQSGVLQRIRTDDLVRYLSRERESLSERLFHMEGELETQKEIIQRTENRTATLLRERAAVMAQFKLISGALKLHQSGDIKERAKNEFAAGQLSRQNNDSGSKNKNKSQKEEAGQRQQDETMYIALGNHSIAREVREKPESSRTQEEREWLAIDMVVNRRTGIYSKEEIQGYSHHRPAELNERAIDCLYELPEELNLAIPFIRSNVQLRAYRLIQKYSFGNDVEDLIRQDRLEASRRRRSSNRIYRVFDSVEHYKLTMQEEGKDESEQDKSLILLRKPKWPEIYKLENQVLKCREGRVHNFYIPENLIVKQLVAHVVYEGGFDERGYVVGRLSAALYLGDSVPIGYCSPSHDVSLCTKESMGRFSLVHDPSDAGIPLKTGRYSIVVGAASLSRYSIKVMAEVCQPFEETVIEGKAEALESVHRLEEIKQDSEHLTVSLYLSERKVKLIEAMVKDAEAKCDSLELEMAKITHVLKQRREREDKGLPGDDSDDEDSEERKKYSESYLVRREAEFDKWVRLASSRRTELADTRHGSQDMARLKRDLEAEVEARTRKLEELRRCGIFTDADLDQEQEERERALEEKEKESHDKLEREAAAILEEQPHAEECWSAIDRVIHPIKYNGSDVQAEEEALCREDLLALMCTNTSDLLGPKAIALNHLLRDKMDASEKNCIESPMLVEPRMLRLQKVSFTVKAPNVETDIDKRCRDVLAELERAQETEAEFLDSSILHGSSQRFPSSVLRNELNRELDRLLVLQVVEQEKFLIKEWRKSLKVLTNQVAVDQPTSLAQNALADLSSSDEDEDDFGGEDENGILGSNQDGEYNDDLEGGADGTSEALEGESRRKNRKKSSSEVFGYCQACRKNPCTWSPPVDMVQLQERIIEVRVELETVKTIDASVRFVETKVAKSVKNGGRSRMLRSDLLRELQTELASLERKERLFIVDEELHRAYASKGAFMETKALHGYRQVQWTQNVVIALESERSRLIGAEVVGDLVDGILDYMLDGWVFGEREVKVEDTLEIDKKGSSDSRKDKNKDVDEADQANEKDAEERVDPKDKWMNISKNVISKHKRTKAVELKEDVDHQLGETENVLKFGLFTLTLMYFRAMTLLNKSKFQDESITGKRRADREIKSVERLRMERSQVRKHARQRAMERAMKKASAGAKKRAELKQAKQLQNQTKVRKRIRKAKLEGAAAEQIQRMFRGHIGRHAARKWAMRRLEEIAQQNLEFAAATAVQRVFRGYQDRKFAEDKRAELAEFISQVRAEEAKEEEEEYLRRNPIKRILRNAGRIFTRSQVSDLEDLDVDFINPKPAKTF